MKTIRIIKKNKNLLIIFIVTLVLFWGLSVLSNYYEWVASIFAIALFPFSILQMVFDNYCLSLNDPHFALPINDEITEIFLFLLFVIGQTVVYYWLYGKCVAFFKEFKRKK